MSKDTQAIENLHHDVSCLAGELADIRQNLKILTDNQPEIKKQREKEERAHEIERLTEESKTLKCPKCQSSMKLKFRKDGGFFFGCIGFPMCKGSLSADGYKGLKRVYVLNREAPLPSTGLGDMPDEVLEDLPDDVLDELRERGDL